MSAVILAQWFDWNYSRKDGDPYWVASDPAMVLTTKETEKSFIVQYGSAGIRKILPKLKRHSKTPRTWWMLYYGSHERMSRTKIEFRLTYP